MNFISQFCFFFTGKYYHLHLNKDQLVNLKSVERQHETLEQRCSAMEEAHDDFTARCEEYDARLSALYEEMAEAVVMKEECEELREKTKKLEEEIKKKEEEEKLKRCRGKTLEDVAPRQRQRKLDQIKTRAKAALWFAETLGLTIRSLTGKSRDGKTVKINLEEDDKSTLSTT